MTNKYEIEYRALLTQAVFHELMSKGQKECDMDLSCPLIIHDIYFCPNFVKKFSEVEMDKVGSYSLRLREESIKGQLIISLNSKIIQNTGDHNAWLEHEISVSSYEECRNILQAIGFKVFFEMTKKRYSFRDDEINVCLEDIESFHPAIEIEILTSSDKAEKAKKQLLDFFKKNHIEKNMIVKKSITNMLMREKAFF